MSFQTSSQISTNNECVALTEAENMVWDDGLVGTARDIAGTDNSPLRVMAGPGTGKSFALKRRVARLLEGNQDPRRILAVTFTRNAAANLVADLHALGVANCESVRAGTLHAFCFSQLATSMHTRRYGQTRTTRNGTRRPYKPRHGQRDIQDTVWIARRVVPQPFYKAAQVEQSRLM